jgi:hypothetical protein
MALKYCTMPQDASLPCPFRALPTDALALVLAHLPLRARLHSAAVAHSWHEGVQHRSAWTRLALESGCSEAALRAAAARAGGGLEALDVQGCTTITPAALQTVVAGNSSALRELRGVGRCYAQEFHQNLENKITFAVRQRTPGRCAAPTLAGRVRCVCTGGGVPRAAQRAALWPLARARAWRRLSRRRRCS